MWTTVVSSIFLIMTFVDSALSEGNGFSPATVEPRISELKTNVHRILEGARIRKKRQLEESDPLVYKLKFDSANPGDLPYLSDFNLTFWIPVHEKQRNQVLIGTAGGHIVLFEVSDENDKTAVTVALSETEDIAIKARAFTYYDEQWFAVLHYSDREYYIQMYQRIGRGLERRQKVDLTGFSDIELVTMKGIHYLIVSSYSSMIGDSFSYQASVTLYHWAQTQFDDIASRMAYGARSVVCWILDGSLYIAVAQETNDEGNMGVGSPIFLYNSKEENRLVLWETLPTFGPSKVQHFYVAGSHYIVVIGKRDAVIYWWSSGQFLEWQSLSGTAEASDVSVLALGDGEVAIVISLKEEALFYTLDSSGRYVITFIMSFKGSSLRSLQFMFSGKVYYALALFAESQHSMWRLTLASHYLPSLESLDPLQQCLLDTQQLLKERQTELETINADLNRVWLKGSNQTITSKVIVEGSITSNRQSRVREIIIIRYANVPDASMSLVIAALSKLNKLADDAKHELDGAVLKSTRQEIRGFKQFQGHVYVPSLTLETTANDVIVNDVRISRLHNYALRKSGDQVFLNTTLVSNVYSETANVASLNGISTDDFLLLHGEQTVTGSLTFSDVSANNAFVGLLNSIPTGDIITTNTPQNITSLKTFSYLKSNTIDVQGETNEVDLSSIHEKIATVDKYNEFMGHLTFLRPVTINGNVFLSGKINKMVDISTLVDKSVKRDIQQDLTGHYTFKGKQTIDGDLLVGGYVNKVSLDNLLTLSSDQKIYADISFSAPLTVKRDLIVGTVNGVDLSEQVLRKTVPHQFINGRKIFTKDITADFVDMTEYITLDGVDPSFLVQDIVQHKQGIIKQNRTILKDVEVLKDLSVLGDINGVDILNFSSSVWLKSVEQTITVPVTTSYMHFKNALDVSKVNNLNLDYDIVHTYSDEVIEGPKVFEFKTVFESLETPNGTINGIDLKSFKIELDKYRNEWEIQGTKRMNSLNIAGNLEVANLNELEVTDIMQPNANQIVYGPVEFTDEVTYIQGNVRSGAISFALFNGQNLQDYFRNAVLSSQPYKPLWNKHFKHLKASNMSISSGGRISGISLDEMMQRAVTLNVPQLITAPKIFASTVNFKKLISAASVNGLVLSSYLNEVVLTDEVSQISHKQFLGDVQTTNAFVRGVISGIKMQDMAANVFYKSEDNVITEHFVFEGDIDVDDIFTPVVDGIVWEDLIFLRNDEILEAGWFLSNVHAEGDIFITGLVNGCNLSQISSSLYTNRSTQVINKNINVTNVVVEGNLIVEKTINKISLGDLQNLITTSDDQIITSDAVIDASLVVDNLHLTDLAYSNLLFIMQDAVRQSIPQEITGQKVFKNDLDTIVLSGGDVFASKVNGVDLEELESTTVWKNGYQEIDGDKILSSLVMNVAIVNGYLNGLKLPEDVVRTDVSEHISHQTYFMSNVYVPTELIVDGLIDGVDLNELINRRITLSSEQNITAELTFHDDITMYDELTIDGTINEIVLDLVAKVKPVHPIQGYKIFVEFHVSGSVTATSVNGFDVVKLSRDILRYNKDEYVNEVQVFEKPVHAQNTLIAEWINNVPIRQLTAAFTTMVNNLQSVLEYLQDLSFDLQQRLNLQLSATQNQIYKFAYFTLFQEIDVGPTSRILHGYSLPHQDNKFSHSLVMWTEEKRCVFMEKCCHLEFSYWLRVKKSGIVMVDSAAESGRYYPIPNPSPVANGKDFFIWKNSTDVQPEWCSNRNARMVLASNDEGGLHDVYIDTESSALLSDVKSFRKGHLYAVASFYFDPKIGEYSSTVVYAYDETRYWSEHQVLPSFGVLSLDVIGYTQGYREDILLALGTGMSTDPPSYSTVYKWNNDDRAFDFLQNIPSRYVTSTLWIQKGRDLLLSLAGVDHWPNKAIDCSELVSGGQIDIYSYKEHLQWIQSIPVGGVVSMVSFIVDGDTYLAAASIQHQTIYIFEWRGYAGFVEIQTISTEVRHLNVYYIDDDVYMAVASVSSPSKILKMTRKGKRSTSFDSFEPTSLEQRDEVPKEPKVVTGC